MIIKNLVISEKWDVSPLLVASISN